MEAITFTQLSLIELEELIQSALQKVLVSAPGRQATTEEHEKMLTVEQAAEQLSLSVPTVYNLVYKGLLPNFKKGKRLYFSPSELRNWIQDGKRKTNLEISHDNDAYLANVKSKMI